MSKRRIVAENWRPKVGERIRLVGHDEDGNEIETPALVRYVGEGRAVVQFGAQEGETGGENLRPR